MDIIKKISFRMICALSAALCLSSCSNDKKIITAFDGGNFSAAENLCLPRIEKNDPKCLYLMGRMSLDGDNGIKDLSKAAKFLKQSADLNHRHAQLLYGIYAYRGDFGGENADEGLKYIRDAAVSGLPEAQFMYYAALKAKKEDSGLEKALSGSEEKEMNDFLAKSAASGNVDAMLTLAVSYCVPDPKVSDCEEKGIPLLEKSSMAGTAAAHRSLGIIRYSRNEFDKSVEPLKKSALQGDGEAAFYLGRIFLAGQAYAEGYKWIKSASENGYKNADGQLAVFSEPGAEQYISEGEKKYKDLAKIIKYNKMILEKRAAAKNVRQAFLDKI